MPYLVDGHNVIAVLQDITLDDPHDEAKLVMKLRAWTARVRRKAIVVFDGGVPGGPSATLSTADVRVIFAARHHTTADRIIHERLSALPDAPNWTVVSSDHEVLDRARAIGARTLTAQQFADDLDRPPGSAKEKPDSVSPAEVLAWLEVFQEVEESQEVSTPGAQARAPKVERQPDARPHRPPQAEPAEPPPRSTRTIAEQMGMSLRPLPRPPKPVGKPDRVSEDEIEDWLHVFQDDPESHIPPPKLPRPRSEAPDSAPVRPEQPAVRKTGTLSAGEVEAWLAVFNDGEAEATKSPGSDREGSRPVAGDVRETPNSRLARHKQKLAPVDDKSASELSEEDRELWQRLFGEDG